jgi:hypothetical protein
MRDLIKKILKEESNQLDMMHFWKNSPKVDDVNDAKKDMDDFMWHLIDYVDFPSDGDNRRIKLFIQSLIRYGLIDVEFYIKMYRWLKIKLRMISSAEEDFQMSLDNVGGDDSYNDWLWHVLSLGKTNFDRLMEGYDDTIEDMEELYPIESFSYAWPHPYDFRD